MIGLLKVVQNPKDDKKLENNEITAENLTKITNNYVKSIECLSLDEFSLLERKQVLQAMISKLCIGGTLSLKFINLDMVANKINKGELTGQKYSSILPYMKSCWSDNESIEEFKTMPVIIKGLYYDSIYSVVSLERIK